jgi:hypothetical protein
VRGTAIYVKNLKNLFLYFVFTAVIDPAKNPVSLRYVFEDGRSIFMTFVTSSGQSAALCHQKLQTLVSANFTFKILLADTKLI